MTSLVLTLQIILILLITDLRHKSVFISFKCLLFCLFLNILFLKSCWNFTIFAFFTYSSKNEHFILSMKNFKFGTHGTLCWIHIFILPIKLKYETASRYWPWINHNSVNCQLWYLYFFFKFSQKILKIIYVEGVYEFKLHPVCTEHQHLLTL